MPEVSLQHLTTNVTGIEPNIGDSLYGELIINVADGRIWVGDENQLPVELGGSVRRFAMGDPNYSNYTLWTIASPENLPIRTIDPTSTTPNFYTRNVYLIEVLSDDVSVTFDHSIDWGLGFKTYGDVVPTDPNATNPIDVFKQNGRKYLIELSTFGRSAQLIGRLLWMSE
jgi:hypothetical protein